MSFVIRIAGAAMPDGLSACPETGQYLRDFDPADHDGRSAFPVTTDIRVAKRFPDAAQALIFWRTQSRIRPLRPDGEPNRPLTAFTVEILELKSGP